MTPTRSSRRLHGIEPTVFAEFSALAARTGALNLGQGAPDVDGPGEVVEAAVAALRGEAVRGTRSANQYPPGIGIAPLRRAVADHQARHYGIALDPETEVAVTTGVTEGISAALLGLVDPGDEVILFEPYYDSYAAMVEMCGARRVAVTLRAPDFALDVDALRAAVTDRTKVIVLNTPHNPTGRVLTRTELAAIAGVAIERDLVVVSDEVYEHLTFDGTEHVPIATLPGMSERTLTLSSMGKSWSFTGWKVGWATGPADLVDALVGAKQWLTYTSGGPLQPAAAYALTHADHWPGELAADLARRRDLLRTGLEAAGLEPYGSQGTYFVLGDVRELGWEDGREFCLALPERAGVVAIPAQGFHDSDAGRHLVRWAFCARTDVITEALERLLAASLHR